MFGVFAFAFMLPAPQLNVDSFVALSLVDGPLVMSPQEVNSPFFQSPIATGLLLYILAIGGLNAWEAYAVPLLKLKKILPDVPTAPGQLTEEQKAVPWITLLTADQRLPLPDKDAILVQDSVHQIGSSKGIPQFVTATEANTNPLPRFRGVQEPSDEWSAHYNTSIVIFKKQRWR